MLHCVINGLKSCVYIASDEANTGCKFEHMYHLKLNMLYSPKYTGWRYSLFRKSSAQDRRACHKPVSHRYHMSGRPLQTKLPEVYILWYIPKLLGLWKRLTRRITRPLHKKTVRWMSDNDISRIVEHLRPSLPQILQNQSRGTMQQQSLPTPTEHTSSATTEAAALLQLFRRPSFVQRHRSTPPHQRNGSRWPTSTTTNNWTDNHLGPDRGVAFRQITLLPRKVECCE